MFVVGRTRMVLGWGRDSLGGAEGGREGDKRGSTGKQRKRGGRHTCGRGSARIEGVETVVAVVTRVAAAVAVAIDRGQEGG